MAGIRTYVDVDNLVQEYVGGKSLFQISKELGVSRACLTDRLVSRNIEIRSHTESHRLSARRYAEAMREKQRGPLSYHERRVLRIIRKKFMPTVWQEAIGSYNVDIAIVECRVAVEINRERPRKTLRSRSCSLNPARIKNILDAGWSVLIVYCPPGFKYRGKCPIRDTMYERFNARKVADKIFSFCEFASVDKTGIGKYGVIDGYGNSTSFPRLDRYSGTRIEGF